MSNPIRLEEAQKLILEAISSPEAELVPLENSVGRILLQPLIADRDYPPFNRSAMDGFAIDSAFYKRDKLYSIKSEIFAGTQVEVELSENECVRIMTGAPVPAACNAVIRIEDASLIDPTHTSFTLDAIRPWQHIARQGEDVQKGEVALSPNCKIGSGEIAIAASLGYSQLHVARKPTVSIVTTGDEIVEVTASPKTHQIRNSNVWTLYTLLAALGIIPESSKHISDSKESLSVAFQSALEQSDVLVVSGGVSAGQADYVPEVLTQLGVEKLFHKVQIKPGKPIWVGKTSEGKMVFALPGNPVSVQVCFKLFVEPWLKAFQGLPPVLAESVLLSDSRTKRNELDEFIMVVRDFENPGHVSLKPFNGSGDITATSGIYGLIRHPAGVTEISKGSRVEFILLK
jgi:molybdopterin molybdotransferase